MLIKDPYLESQRKDPEFKSQPQIINHNTSSLSQPAWSDVNYRNRAASSHEVNDLRSRVHAYEKELRSMEGAYMRQEEATRKMMDFNEVNRGYHEAMKLRNFELNVT